MTCEYLFGCEPLVPLYLHTDCSSGYWRPLETLQINQTSFHHLFSHFVIVPFRHSTMCFLSNELNIHLKST